MSSLPPKISFTRLPNGLSRRDLFDSRFQILSESDEPQDSALIQGQHSDLQAGIYEGGFKTWECAHDLVEFLERTNQSFDGFKICELGCGSALPSCAALRTRLQSSSTQPTTLILQDFNKEGEAEISLIVTAH